MQLNTKTPPIRPTRRGHNFDAKRYRGRAKRRIAPLATVDRLDSVTPPSAEKVWCPRCEKCHASAVTYDQDRDEAGLPERVHRVSYCDGCEQVYFWKQYCNFKGEPVGRPIRGSLVINDKASVVETVLKNYPQLRGIEDVHPHY